MPRAPKTNVYEEWGRTYIIDGNPYPSVTTVLGIVHIPRLQKWRITKALERGWEASQRGFTLSQTKAGDLTIFPKQHPATQFGTDVHAHIEAVLNGVEPDEDIDGRRTRHVQSAMRFLVDQGAEPTMVEQGLYDPYYSYAGTTDLYCRLPDGRTAIVDWKTGQVWPRHALQAVACASAPRLLERNADHYKDCTDIGEAPRVDTTFMVYTGDDANYQHKEIPVDDPVAMDMWKASLKMFHLVNSPEYETLSGDRKVPGRNARR